MADLYLPEADADQARSDVQASSALPYAPPAPSPPPIDPYGDSTGYQAPPPPQIQPTDAPPLGSNGPWAPPSDPFGPPPPQIAPQQSSVFDPNAYDAPFQPGGDYGGGQIAPPPQSGVFGRAAMAPVQAAQGAFGAFGGPQAFGDLGLFGALDEVKEPRGIFSTQPEQSLGLGTALEGGISRIPLVGKTLAAGANALGPGGAMLGPGIAAQAATSQMAGQAATQATGNPLIGGIVGIGSFAGGRAPATHVPPVTDLTVPRTALDAEPFPPPVSAGYPGEESIPIRPVVGDPYAGIPQGYVRAFRGETPGAPRGATTMAQNLFTPQYETAARYGNPAAGGQVYFADIPRAAAEQWGLGTPEGLPPDMAPGDFDTIHAIQHGNAKGDISYPLQGPPITRASGYNASPETAGQPFPPLDESTAEAARVQKIIDAQAQRYGGVPAGQVDRAPGGAEELAAANAVPNQTDPEVRANIARATERGMGGTAPVDVTAAYRSPVDNMLQRIQDAKPLQEQNAELLHRFRGQQAGAAASFDGSEASLNSALVGMRGTAERVSMEPLYPDAKPGDLDPLLKQVADTFTTSSGANGRSETLTGINTAQALREMLVNGRVPTAGEIPNLERAFPGITESLQQSGVLTPPPKPFARTVLNSARDFLSRPIATLNNTARSTETILDVASPGRELQTAGLYSPDLYAKSWADVARTGFTKDPEGYIQAVWDRVNATPDPLAGQADVPFRTLADRGITVDSMFDREGFGLHGAQYDPYSGGVAPGGGLGIPSKLGDVGPVAQVGQRLQFLNNFNQIFRPQALREEVVTKLQTGELPRDFSLVQPGSGASNADWARYYRDVASAQDIGRGVDLITGHSTFRPFGEETNLLLNFGNWTAAQMDIIARGVGGTASGAADLVPGVSVNTSYTNQIARGALGRLALLGTMATVAINEANHVKPNDPRAWRNGIPMVVITPAVAQNLKAIPALGRIANFVPNTQFDLYGPLGEMIQHAAGVVRKGVEGASSGVGGALGGAAGEAAYWGKGMLAWTPKVAVDLLTKDNYGQKPTLLNEAPIPFNTSGFVGDNQRATGATVGGMGGLRFHEPNELAQLRSGTLDYQSLSGPDQFKMIHPQAWKAIADGAPSELKGQFNGANSYYDWYQKKLDEITPLVAAEARQKGFPEASVPGVVQNAIARDPVDQAYHKAIDYYETEWIKAHPQDALKEWQRQSGLSYKDQTWLPTKAQQATIAQLTKQAVSSP